MDEFNLYANLEGATLVSLRDNERTKLGILATQASKFSSGYVPIQHTSQITDALVTLELINSELTRRGIPSIDPAPSSAISQIVQHYTEQRVTARNNGDVANIRQERSDPASSQIVEADGGRIRGVTQISGKPTDGGSR